MPHVLYVQQKLPCFEICSLLLHNQNDSILDQIVTCDDKWILCDNRKHSGQLLDTDDLQGQFPNAEKPKKTIFTLWWRAASLFQQQQQQLPATGQTVTAYCHIEKISMKCTENCDRSCYTIPDKNSLRRLHQIPSTQFMC